MPSVPVGAVSYPRLSAGTSADVRDDGVEIDGTAAALTTVEINPVRVTASYTYGTETLSRIRGFEDALRMDVQSTLEDKMDFLALQGQAVVNNVSPKIDGLLNSLTDPGAAAAIATFSTYLSAFDGRVDGKYAMDSDEARLLVNAPVYKHAMGLGIGAAGCWRAAEGPSTG